MTFIFRLIQRVSLSFGPSYVEKGKNITLPVCHVTSFPQAVITWVKVYDNLEQSRVVAKDGQLSIKNTQKKDTGLYKCTASNPLGHDSAVTHLNVVELPHFTIRPPSQLEVDITKNVTIRCQATGNPQPKITWMKESGELPDGRSEVGVNGTLKIWNLKKEDSGKYTCVASSNKFFKAFAATKLSAKKRAGKKEDLILFLPFYLKEKDGMLEIQNPTEEDLRKILIFSVAGQIAFLSCCFFHNEIHSLCTAAFHERNRCTLC